MSASERLGTMTTILKYELFRNGVGPPIYTTQISSNFWTLPTATYTDTGMAPGATAYYQVRITDPNGNTQWSRKAARSQCAAQPPNNWQRNSAQQHYSLQATQHLF